MTKSSYSQLLTVPDLVQIMRRVFPERKFVFAEFTTYIQDELLTPSNPDAISERNRPLYHVWDLLPVLVVVYLKECGIEIRAAKKQIKKTLKPSVRESYFSNEIHYGGGLPKIALGKGVSVNLDLEMIVSLLKKSYVSHLSEERETTAA